MWDEIMCFPLIFSVADKILYVYILKMDGWMDR